MPEDSEFSRREEEREEKPKYPVSIYFLLGYTFCDKFCFYGIQVILTIYLRHRFEYTENTAMLVYHTFMGLSYFIPLFGAIIADSWLGKFWTIFHCTIFYASGSVILSAASAFLELMSLEIISLVALFIISIGSGGLKPCLQAFGGDQFEENQIRHREFFFSMLYFTTNCGGLTSMILTPILREDVHCFGELSCYPLAFSVPALFIIAGLLLLVSGKCFYKVLPAEGSTVMGVISCISHALYRKAVSSGEKRQHWLEFANDKYDRTMIRDIQALLHILWIFLPVSFFWTLYDQSNSRWVLQATKMKGETYGFNIKPDQLQVVNPILIVILLPIFETVIYPLLAKFHFLTKNLEKMTVGGVLAVMSFIIAGLVSLAIEASEPQIPKKGLADLTIVNNSPCNLNITTKNVSLDKFESKKLHDIHLKGEHLWKFLPRDCAAPEEPTAHKFNISSAIHSMMVTLQKEQLQIQVTPDHRNRSEIGHPKIRLFYSLGPKSIGIFELKGPSHTIYDKLYNQTNHGITSYVTATPGSYVIRYYTSYNATSPQDIGKLDLRSGGSYIIAIYMNATVNETNMFPTEMVEPNSVHILFLIIQYVLITAGEMMLSITGMQFSYSQAPRSMKTAALAGWLLTSAVGNLLVIFMVEITFFENQSSEFFIFATLMGVDITIFAMMAHSYVYLDE